MLACHACIRKIIHIFLADVIGTPISILNRTQSHRLIASPAKPPRSWARRTLTSSAETEGPAPAQGSTDPMMPFYTTQKQRAVMARLAFDKNSLKEELVYLRDPLKLAEHVDGLVKKDGFDKAAELVRMAGKNMPCTVSWNHLIDHEMSKGRVANAVKLYNEMKKRAQLPDARTFTILFRGFAKHPQYPQSLDRALSIYETMFAENSPVKPSIIHTNAVLYVCARALDIDAMLGVAAKLPTRGPKAPNKVTFTVIMNAIRIAMVTKGKAMNHRERRESLQTAANQGRRIWAEVRDRWQDRDIEIDEETVCAMGRLLLLRENDQENDEVLSLVEQTMGIPRQLPRLKNGNDKVGWDQNSRNGQVTNSDSNVKQPEVDGWTDEESKQPTASQSASELVESEDEEETFGNEFDAVDLRKIEYLHPGNDTLSMVMHACLALKAPNAAQDYWGLLTDPAGEYKITPDADNYHVYLRLLRSKRSSKRSVEMVEELCYKSAGVTKFLHPKIFRIALSTCIRDANNPNSLTHANKLVRIMLDSLAKPDVRTLSAYLRLALKDQHRQWESLMGVLRGCEISVRNLRSDMAFSQGKKWGAKVRSDEQEVIDFVTGLARAFQTAMSLGQGQMSFEDEKFCKVQYNKMLDWTTRMKQMGRGVEQQEEKHDMDGGVREEGEEEEEGEEGEGEDDQRRSSDEIRGKPQGRWKPFIGTTYRPTSIFQSRRALAHQTRMRRRGDAARETLARKYNEDEEW